MCGIAGLVSALPAQIATERLRCALSRMEHRGPDDNGVEAFSLCGRELLLGHRRLSIIDLTSAGHQPMQSANGRFVVTFNGEIYNYKELRRELVEAGYRLTSDSDTEVLLEAWACWGEACLPKLVGMFAFAVLDREENKLTLVRDAFGIKPLFFDDGADQFAFASELPALLEMLASKPGMNMQRVYDYLVHGAYDNSEATFFEGIKQLLPGHLVTVNLRTGKVSAPVRWWWPSIHERGDLTFNEAVETVRAMFLDNVRLHLRSDVPVGAALSGGVDSSAVVCAMRLVEPDMPIHTFTFVAPGSSVDEESWADIVNAHVRAMPHKVVVDPSELGRDLDDMIRSQGEPFGSTSIYAQYRVFKAAKEAGIIVTLDGQGADELLAGYHGYPTAYLRSLFESRGAPAAARFLLQWARWPGRGVKTAAMMLGASLVPNRLRGVALTLIGRSPRPDWLQLDALVKAGVEMRSPSSTVKPLGVPARRLAGQLRHALTEDGLGSLLRHGDRNSMRWSIESRVPFLTTEMAEYLLTLPESFLLSDEGETKRVFRAAMRGIVPDEILDRRDKIGFQTPERAWLNQQRVEVMGWLSDLETIPFLKASSARAEVESVISGDKPFNQSAWRLINFARWAQLHA